MKHAYYSIIAAIAAITGVASTHRPDTTYSYRLIVHPTTVHDLTLTTNWTYTFNDAFCTGTFRYCQLQSTTHYVTILNRHVPYLTPGSGKINAAQSAIPGVFKLLPATGTDIQSITNADD